MEWITDLNRSIDYLEEQLTGKPDYEEAARHCRCTPSKYQQMFLLATGITASEYVRYRRMTCAAYDLTRTKAAVLDIALKYGYESPEAFCRAYQNFHGRSPTASRKAKKHNAFHKISFQLNTYGGFYKMGNEAVLNIETERLVIRKFTPDDWRDLLEIAVSNQKSEFSAFDHEWPTDEAGIKKAAEYFASGSPFWAVELKEPRKVICFINFNFIDDNALLDIGHVVNGDFLHRDYEYEALKALYNFAFIQLGVKGIRAGWILEDKDKLEPLYKLGMKVTETSPAQRMRPDAEGKTDSPYHGCILAVTRQSWIANPAI